MRKYEDFKSILLGSAHVIRLISARKATKKEINMGGDSMREEYDIKNLNPRKNPYSNRIKRQITINLDAKTIEYFKGISEETGIPYQTLINSYLTDCANSKKTLQMLWK